MMPRINNRFEELAYFAALAVTLLVLYLSSRFSYLLFHSLVELTTIAIGFTLFILTWNARRFLPNDCFKLLGIGYAFASVVDLIHALAYKGMNVFPGGDANLPTQLWIAARYLQAATLFAAPLFISRKINEYAIFGTYLALVTAIVALAVKGNFPDCYIEGEGLTTFKIASEFVIIAILLAALLFFHKARQRLNGRVLLFIIASIVCTVVSELSFTAYLSVYSFANLLGHLLKLAAFYFIYKAVLVTGFREPFDLIFRDLKLAEGKLRKAHDNLEATVSERSAELRTSEQKYRALIESANDAIFIHELRPDGSPGPFAEVNELACRRLGYSREEFARLSPLELDDPACRGRIAEAMRQLQENGHAVFETAQMAKDGRSIPVEVSSRVIGIGEKRLIFSLVRDISERKRLELEKDQYFHFFMLSTDAMCIADPFGCFRKVNPALVQLTGYDEVELVSKPFLDFVLPEDREKTVREMELQVKVRASMNFENRYVRKDGTVILLSWTAYFDKNDGVTYATAHDITASRRAEDEIRKLNSELEQRVRERTAQLEAANKELEAFSYSVSHDLRAPLRAIDGYSNILLEDYGDKLDEEGKRVLGVVRANTMRMDELIVNILDFSRMGRREIEAAPVDMTRLAHEVAEELQATLGGRNVRFEIGELPSARGDRTMLRQVFVNLLSNAVKFTQPRAAAAIEVGSSAGTAEHEYFVRDNGVGFDMHYADKLFGVFQRLHSVQEFEGTGIGLAIVKRIIMRHGGRVWAEGKPGEGAMIHFSLPCNKAAG